MWVLSHPSFDRERAPPDTFVPPWASHPFPEQDATLGAATARCWACSSPWRQPVGEHAMMMRKCSGCLVATYCSAACSAVDWRGGHRPACGGCRAFAAARAAHQTPRRPGAPLRGPSKATSAGRPRIVVRAQRCAPWRATGGPPGRGPRLWRSRWPRRACPCRRWWRWQSRVRGGWTFSQHPSMRTWTAPSLRPWWRRRRQSTAARRCGSLSASTRPCYARLDLTHGRSTTDGGEEGLLPVTQAAVLGRGVTRGWCGWRIFTRPARLASRAGRRAAALNVLHRRA